MSHEPPDPFDHVWSFGEFYPPERRCPLNNPDAVNETLYALGATHPLLGARIIAPEHLADARIVKVTESSDGPWATLDRKHPTEPGHIAVALDYVQVAPPAPSTLADFLSGTGTYAPAEAEPATWTILVEADTESFEAALDAVLAKYHARFDELLARIPPAGGDTPTGTDRAPDRYTRPDGRETIDVIRSTLGDEGFVAWCTGNRLKYLDRAISRPATADVDRAKAEFYGAMVDHVNGAGLQFCHNPSPSQSLR